MKTKILADFENCISVPLIIKSLLENLSQLASSLLKNHDKQNDIKITKKNLPSMTNFH